MPKYISCITRMLLNSHRIFMSACPGEPSLYDTHCQYCHYWVENQPEILEEDDDEDISEQQSCPSDRWSERENLSEQIENGNDILEDNDEEEDV